jgi:phage tail protein X
LKLWEIILSRYESFLVSNDRWKRWNYQLWQLEYIPEMKELYKFFKFNGKEVDWWLWSYYLKCIFEKYQHDNHGKPGWESMLPSGIAEIKEHQYWL